MMRIGTEWRENQTRMNANSPRRGAPLRAPASALPLAGIRTPAKGLLIPSAFIGVYRRQKITLIKTDL